jgi:HK97 family phage prohead protease
MNDQTERRLLGADNCEFRVEAEEGGARYLRGSFAVFNSPSEDLGGFIEYLQPGAFREVLGNDVRALFNHDPSQLLGRTTNGTLTLSETDGSANYQVELDTDHVAEFVARKVARRDVTGNSFAFAVAEGDDEWRMEDGVMVRRIHRVARLLDVGPVTYPAYRATTVSARALDTASVQLGFDVSEYWKRHYAAWANLPPTKA